MVGADVVAVVMVVVSVTVVVSVVVSVSVVGTCQRGRDRGRVGRRVVDGAEDRLRRRPGAGRWSPAPAPRVPSRARSAPARARPRERPATRMILPFRCTVTVAASAELCPRPSRRATLRRRRSPRAPALRAASGGDGCGTAARWRPAWPFPSRARGATTGSDTAAAAAAAATSSGSGSETGGGWADAPTGIGATASSLRFGTRRITTIVSSRRTMTRTNPFTTRIPTAMSSRSITLLPDPRRRSVPRSDAFVTPGEGSLREECSGGDDGRAPCPPRSPISSMRPSRPRLPGSGCTPRAGRSRSRRRTPSSGGRHPRSPSWASGRVSSCWRRPGTRPSTCSPGSGATYAGAIIVAVNPRAGENELAGLIRQVRPRLVVTDATAPSTVRESGGATIDVAALYSRPAGPDAAAAGP